MKHQHFFISYYCIPILLLWCIVSSEVSAQRIIDYPNSTEGITLKTTDYNMVCYSTTWINMHSNEVNGIKFAKSFKYYPDDYEEHYYATLTVNGGFKAGDIIEIVGVYNNSDDTKSSAIVFYSDPASEPIWCTEEFINGRTDDRDPILQTFAITQDTETLYFGRRGNTSTYILQLTVKRGEISKVSSVEFNRKDNELTMSSNTPNSTIYYTLDGSSPTRNSNKYTGPITLTQNCTVKAFALADGYENSDVASYTVDWFKVEDVSIAFTNMKVQMSTTTPNARIYYTIDGAAPTENSTRYTEPFSVSGICTVKAIAFKDNFIHSNITSLYIDLENIRCEAPVFQMSGNVLTITSQTEGTAIYYTLDGSEPTTESSKYNGPITLTRNGIVKAIAVREGFLNSAVNIYEVTYFQVETPSFTAEENVLTISCETQGASIYYIIGNGDLAIIEQNRYIGPITLTDNRPVRAIGVLDGYRNSTEVVYNHNSITCGDVTFNYDGHFLQLSSSTDGAAIYYTIDGSNPSVSTLKYNDNKIAVDGLYTVKAVAVKQDMNNSKVTSMEIPYFYDGETASVREAGQLNKAFEWNQGAITGKLKVKGNLNAADISFIQGLTSIEHLQLVNVSIEGDVLPDNAFANMNIVSIELPAGLKTAGVKLFENCHHLAAIVWNADIDLTSEMLSGINNPNLLLYVNRTTLAPWVDNVISLINNWSSNIVLQDVTDGDGNFYCPLSFTASKISYTRNFTLRSGKGASAGWETIALPFNVATISHETNGQLAPFGNNVLGSKPFWLYSLEKAGLNPAMEIIANTPYVICMPNHEDYADEYNQGGNVTFSASNVEVPVTSPVTSTQETDRSYISLIPAFSRRVVSSDMYVINKDTYKTTFAPGSIFVPGLRDAYPFEVYSLVTMKSETMSPPAYIPILANGTLTAIEELMSKEGKSESWYTLDGRKLQGKPTTKGLYIVNGRKVVVNF